MKREYHKWFSRHLNRDMELLVFGHAGARVLVFPTREGRFFDYENWGLVDASAASIDAGQVQLFCVDSVDSESFYCKHAPPWDRLARHKSFEQYILHEVIPFSLTQNPNPVLVAHGCSIGAYHAANIAFRHPRLFHKVVALSGRFDLTREMGPFPDLFGGYYDEDIYFHMPNHFLPNLTDYHALESIRQMEVVLAVGHADPFHESNLALSRALTEKDLPHTLAIWDGEAHRAKYWRQMVKLYL